MTNQLDRSLASALRDASDEEKADLLLGYIRDNGSTNYDPNVTQMEHALQTATLARSAGASPQQVVSALLHDIGHLLVKEHAGESDFLAEDMSHEAIGADYLEPFFDQDILEPIRLHVPAKRYLCTTDAEYYDGLSEASKRSFAVQGGNMSDQELAVLRANPHLEASLQLRRWDDRGKVSNLKTPGLEAFRDDLIEVLS